MRLHPFRDDQYPMLTTLLLLVRIYLLALVILWLGQEFLLFPGVVLGDRHHPRHVDWAEVVEVTRPDASTFPALLANGHHDRLVVLTHGNGEAASMLDVYAERLDELGFATALMEYRGFAGVSGWPRETVLSADLDALLDALLERGYAADRTVLHGRSIGGGVAATGAHRVAGLVLESSFDSLRNTARDRWVVRIFPLGLLLRSPLDSQRRLSALDLPVLQVHDDQDAVVSVERARSLRDSLSRGRWIQTRGLAHGAPLVLVHGEARASWQAFLEEVVPP